MLKSVNHRFCYLLKKQFVTDSRKVLYCCLKDQSKIFCLVFHFANLEQGFNTTSIFSIFVFIVNFSQVCNNYESDVHCMSSRIVSCISFLRALKRRIWTFFVKIVNGEKPPRTPFLQNTYHWLPSKTVRENTVNKSRRNWVKNIVLNQIKTEIRRIAVTFLPKVLRAFNVHSIKKHNISI